MNKESLYKIVKLQNDDKVVLVKSGNFYRAYDVDGILMWSIFGYKVIEGRASFPNTSFGSVISKLNRLGVSVVVVSKENDIINYFSTTKNTYKEYVREAIKKYELDEKINEIKFIVENKIKNNLINYNKLLEFLNTL